MYIYTSFMYNITAILKYIKPQNINFAQGTFLSYTTSEFWLISPGGEFLVGGI
jgi:hypothetical protein